MQVVSFTIKGLLNARLLELENHLNADIFCYSGPIADGLENEIRNAVEDLAKDNPRKNRLVVILTTTGGSVFTVERYVNIIRRHYEIVDFIIPNYAYSAGTIFCMSGDNIFMDYFSVLGPIDPQVLNKEGRWVAALGYLDKVNEAIEKSKNGMLSDAELLLIKDLDLADLKSYEQAKELTIELLKKWLVKYKFKNWNTHQNNPKLLGKKVSIKEKEKRAEKIAHILNSHAIWKSHGRPINIETLQKIGLKIDDFSKDPMLNKLIQNYYGLLTDYIDDTDQTIFIHTRKFN